MKVCIIGWYGTETIGDRAILAGTLAFLAQAFDDLTVSLGSLYPFFSERTVAEDKALWEMLIGRTVEVELFDSSRERALKNAIKSSELLLLGGGPLMDLREMHMLAFAFCYARSHKVKTGVFGCGIGPLEKPVFKKAAVDILKHSDFAIFRDSLSEAAAQRLCDGYKLNSYSAIDPAAYCAFLFKQNGAVPEPAQRIAINLRKISQEYGDGDTGKRFDDFAVDMVSKIMEANSDCKVMLVPNHYFFVGGDDRSFLNQINYRIGNRGLRIQNRPQSLHETMATYASSACCVGMRFHSVLLMGLLNGKCRIVNYTGTKKGKIAGFLHDFDPDGFFKDRRMISLDSEEWDLSIFDNMMADECFNPDPKLLEAAFDTYRSVLADLL